METSGFPATSVLADAPVHHRKWDSLLGVAEGKRAGPARKLLLVFEFQQDRALVGSGESAAALSHMHSVDTPRVQEKRAHVGPFLFHTWGFCFFDVCVYGDQRT